MEILHFEKVAKTRHFFQIYRIKQEFNSVDRVPGLEPGNSCLPSRDDDH